MTRSDWGKAFAFAGWIAISVLLGRHAMAAWIYHDAVLPLDTIDIFIAGFWGFAVGRWR